MGSSTNRQAVQYRPATVPVGSKSLADSMLASYDEAQIHSRLAAEREREDMIELDGAPVPLCLLYEASRSGVYIAKACRSY